MSRSARISTVIVVVFLGFALERTMAAQEQGPFAGLIAAAQAVVAVEILSADYRATPADGPMVAEAKVLKALKGSLARGQTFRFTETAWVGPTYQKGEYRILFLERDKTRKVLRPNPWRILSHLYARNDFFVEKKALPALSLASLESFLKKFEDSKARPGKLVFDTTAVK